ncbi:MAG: hypothetical protein HYV32_02830 [Candidatus Kerfeldbacteria bacterium]|nr:hypothetical protein [Candidatus Kerfeldbacteria bacterium]
MTQRFYYRMLALPAAVFFAFMFFTTTVHAADSLYGALYYVDTLPAVDDDGDEDVDQFNFESVVTYAPGEDGFIAITTNDPMRATANAGMAIDDSDAFSEWWVSNDALGTQWERSETNPLDEYYCGQVGRHSVVTFNDEVYFAAACQGDGETDTPHIFRLTGQDSVELVYVHVTEDDVEAEVVDPEDPESDQEDEIGNDTDGEDVPGDDQGGSTVGNYPTAAVIGDTLYMFFNGGYTVCDVDENCEQVTDTANQPEDGVPLEASSEQDGVVYLAFTTGEVMSFDGDTYTTIASSDQNLPAIQVYNDTVYVGNAAIDEGSASLFKYVEDDDGDVSNNLQTVIELPENDFIINKMGLTSEIDDTNYLTFYTSNNAEGVHIYYVDGDDNVGAMVDSMSTEYVNNQEVVSVVNREVDDNGTDKQVMLFGTQNGVEQTEIFLLNPATDLAIDPDAGAVVSATNRVIGSIRNAQGVAKGNTTQGGTFRLQVPKDQVQVGDVFTLRINGKVVDRVKARKGKNVVLKYKKARRLKAGKSFNVQVGRRVAYGKGADQLLSENIILGEKMKVTVRSEE